MVMFFNACKDWWVFVFFFFFLFSGKRGSLALEDGCLTALKCYLCKSCLFSKTE